jgi:geranylgeranyl reductase family protein
VIWDVAVVGAGPAGAAAAREAASAGARTVLLEKGPLPRYKRCGGGLIGPSQQLLKDAGIDVAALSHDHVGRVTFTHLGKRSVTRETDPFLPMVLRSELDLALVQAAADAGATIKPSTPTAGYAEQDGVVTLATSAGPIRARAVVAADGSAGRGGGYVGVVCDQVDIGLEAEIPTPRGSDWEGRVLLDWGPVPGSYGWVFPKGPSLTVGVIGDRDQGQAMRDYYKSFVASLGLDLADATVDGGHQTRVRQGTSPLHRGQVLVAGDAAGLLEPWSREGISFALRSGRLAGSAAVGDVSAYPSAVEAELGPEMALGRRALQVFSRSPGIVHTAMRRLPVMWPLFVDVVRGST